MPRGKKRTETQSDSETNAEISNVEGRSESDAPLDIATEDEPFAVMTPSESTLRTETDPEIPSSAITPRGQFRSWTVDDSRGYVRMTDNKHNRLVFQFAAKPDQEVIESLKEGGFEFKSDYYGQKSVWVRPNDFEGRLQADRIEMKLRGVGAEPDLPDF